MYAVCHILAQCFIKDSASPFASGSSALEVGLCSIPAHWKYCCNRWYSPPLNGGPLSDVRVLQYPWRENIESNASMFASALVLFTGSTSGNRLNLPITTKRYLPSGVGPQWSVARSFQTSLGGTDGVSGSLCFVSVDA